MRNYLHHIRKENKVSDCSKCNRTDIKCCHTCKKDANNCNVWHNCGSDCPEYEAKATTNADRIRSMTDEELAQFLVNFKNTFGEEYEGEASCLDWLQSEVEGE